MKNGIEIKIALAIIILLAVSVMASSEWHNFQPFPIENISMQLDSYTVIAGENEQACFTVTLNPYFLKQARTIELSSRVKETALNAFTLKVFENPVSSKQCFNSNHLTTGDNLIELNGIQQKLFFHVNKIEEKVVAVFPPEINLGEVTDNSIEFTITAPSFNSVEKAEILVNDISDHKVYFQPGLNEYKEKIELKEGENEITISMADADKTINKTINYTKSSTQLFNPLIGFGLIFFMLIVFLLMVFSGFGLIEKISLSLTSTIILFIFNSFVLNVSIGIQPVYLLVLTVLELIVLTFVFRKKLKTTKVNFKKTGVNLLIVLALLTAILMPLSFHLTSSSHLTYWNGFYERQSQAILDNGFTPLNDELSYFGRGYTFIPGYFLFESSTGFLTGLNGTELFSIMLAFGSLIFFFSVMFFARSLKLSLTQAAVIYFFLLLCMFVLTGVILSPRHILSFSLALITLGLMFRKEKFYFPAVLLAFTGFIQIPMLVFIPLAYVFLSKKIEWKYLIQVIVLSLIVFLALFSPSLYAHGMPYEVEVESWGYGIKVPVTNIWFDVGLLLVFVLLFSLINLKQEKIKLDKWQKKLLIAIVLSFLIQFLLTYRWNMFTSLTMGLVLSLFIPKRILEDRFAQKLLIIIIFSSLAFAVLIMHAWTINGYALQPMEFLKEQTSSSDRVLSDPLFGHSIAFFTSHPILADLYVEYADQEKLNDAYKFLEEKDYTILKKYDIDLIVNQVDYINKNAVNNQPLPEPLEFRELDKVYSNGFIFVHKVRG
ncbi:MAG: hypothetical protein ABH821_06365 [archaeon]